MNIYMTATGGKQTFFTGSSLSLRRAGNDSRLVENFRRPFCMQRVKSDGKSVRFGAVFEPLKNKTGLLKKVIPAAPGVWKIELDNRTDYIFCDQKSGVTVDNIFMQGNMGFMQIIDEFGGTPTANVANAYAGLALAQTGRYEEAIPYLKAFDGSDNMVAPGVLGALGNCYANTGDLSSAVSKFIEAAKVADNNTVSPYCLLQAGLIYEKQGKKEDALKVYTQIKEKYFASVQAMDIDKYINRVK